LARIVQLLDSTDDRVALMAARDLLDRIGARAPDRLELAATVPYVEAADVKALLGQLAAQKAISGPTKEERVVRALAEQLGLSPGRSLRRAAGRCLRRHRWRRR
jgi:hypothetical protein